MGESDPNGHGGDLDGARLDPAVPGAAGKVHGRDGAPGQGLEMGVQLRVTVYGEQVVRATADQVLGVLALGVQGVRRYDRAGQVKAVQQRREGLDFIGLSVHNPLPDNDVVGVIERGEQVRGTPLRRPVRCAGLAATAIVGQPWQGLATRLASR